MKNLTINPIVLTVSAMMLSGCGERKAGYETDSSTQADAGYSGHSGGKLLEPGYPPALYSFTPKPIKVPNLVRETEAAPVFLVPEGTKLLSRGKSVTSSDPNPLIGLLKLITDGDKQAADGYVVELAPGPQWVQIDLEKSVVIHAIWIWHQHGDMRACHDGIVRISDDPEFKTGVITLFNNDYDDSSKLGKGTQTWQGDGQSLRRVAFWQGCGRQGNQGTLRPPPQQWQQQHRLERLHRGRGLRQGVLNRRYPPPRMKTNMEADDPSRELLPTVQFRCSDDLP